MAREAQRPTVLRATGALPRKGAGQQQLSNGLSKFKNEVARELGVPFSDYNGDLSSRQCGSVGGEMVKRMVEAYESQIK